MTIPIYARGTPTFSEGKVLKEIGRSDPGSGQAPPYWWFSANPAKATAWYRVSQERNVLNINPKR
ncbi:MAG: hypothetical protein ABSB15_17895 [Bryobacteraceae bacterium]|jgi:hypothetical protein